MGDLFQEAEYINSEFMVKLRVLQTSLVKQAQIQKRNINIFTCPVEGMWTEHDKVKKNKKTLRFFFFLHTS